ncbi:hypothetical protein O181_090173, partial [Austropuccinia psidii MF-1]|nr:hypothetical protein [Austropuccinia psidii MF-1]
VRRAYFPPHPDPLAKTSCLADPRFFVPTSLLTLIHWLRPPVLPIQDYETGEALKRTPRI